MATESTRYTQDRKNMDPAQSDVDPDQISADGGTGSEAGMYEDLEEAQTAGSRNDRVTEYSGGKHKVEPTTASEYPTGRPPQAVPADAPGITNRSLHEEKPGQDKVMKERASASSDVDASGVLDDSDKPIEGGLPSRKQEKVEIVEISSMTPKH